MKHASYDIVIVGGGIVGASLACLLAQGEREISIALVDAEINANSFTGETFDPRVVALSKASEAILRKIDVWEDIVAMRACPYFEMHVWDAEGTGGIHFDSADIHADNLGHIIENNVAVAALYKKINAGSNNIEFMAGSAVEQLELASPGDIKSADATPSLTRGVLTLADGRVLSAPIIIGADGARSEMRVLAGLETREWQYGHSAIVTTVTTELPHQYAAWQRFSTAGPLAFLPLVSGDQNAASRPSHQCSIVWSITSALSEQMMALSTADFCQALGRAFEGKLGKVLSSDQRHCIPLSQRHATRYTAPGFAVIGDAAHTIHPLAGQGANLGIYDAKVLAEEIIRALERKVSLDDASILKRYQRIRQPHNLLAMTTMEGFKRLFEAQDPGLRWLRNTGLTFFDNQGWLKKQMSKLASGQM